MSLCFAGTAYRRDEVVMESSRRKSPPDAPVNLFSRHVIAGRAASTSFDLHLCPLSMTMGLSDYSVCVIADQGARIVATRTITTLVDDLDGKELDSDGRTIQFSYDGIDYQIDLGPTNVDTFAKAIEPYVAAATRIGGRKNRSRPVGASFRSGVASDPTPSASTVREWARENGYDVSDRGRIPAAVLEAWQLAS